MDSYSNSSFAITTMAVGVLTGVKIVNWLGAMWGGQIQLMTAILFLIGFLFEFLMGA
jgi:cytochrome c oxidase subunit 1